MHSMLSNTQAQNDMMQLEIAGRFDNLLTRKTPFYVWLVFWILLMKFKFNDSILCDHKLLVHDEL